MISFLIVAAVFGLGECEPSDSERAHYGKLIGSLQEISHGVKGTVYAVNESAIFVKGFSYDGTGPKAYFWVGSTPEPSPEGYILPYPVDYVAGLGKDPPILEAFNDMDVVLKFPPGKMLKDVKWFSVWCRKVNANFGNVSIPPDLEPPRMRVLPEFSQLAHGLQSGNITIVDAKTFRIPNFHYDGLGPAARFWVGNGSEPGTVGVEVPDEVKGTKPLRSYNGEDIEIQLPDELTVYDIDWLSVWCLEAKKDFGHVNIPKDLDVPPALSQPAITTKSPDDTSTDGTDISTGSTDVTTGSTEITASTEIPTDRTQPTPDSIDYRNLCEPSHNNILIIIYACGIVSFCSI